jgi:Transglutaminase-like superfamily
LTRHRIDLATLRAALWAQRALLQARRDLRRGHLEDIELLAPPHLPRAAERGVHALLRRRPASCLEKVLVLQRWYAAVGESREIVIGVKGPVDEFTAHAWLDGDPDGESRAFQELLRLPSA